MPRGRPPTPSADPLPSQCASRNDSIAAATCSGWSCCRLWPQSVTVTLHAGQTRHDLTVADTGPGLPPGFQDRMFERFARAPRDSDVAGHGLGLALVQAIALRHGARISLPPVDRGFAIRISWPAVPQDI